jgi:hypothetical protein
MIALLIPLPSTVALLVLGSLTLLPLLGCRRLWVVWRLSGFLLATTRRLRSSCRVLSVGEGPAMLFEELLHLAVSEYGNLLVGQGPRGTIFIDAELRPLGLLGGSRVSGYDGKVGVMKGYEVCLE